MGMTILVILLVITNIVLLIYFITNKKVLETKMETVVQLTGLLMSVGGVNKKLLEKTHMNKNTKNEMTKQNVAMLEMATNIMKNNLKGTK